MSIKLMSAISKTKRYSFEWKKIKAILQKTNGLCFYCKTILPPDTNYLDDLGLTISSQRNWHIDHMLPLSKGGSNHIDNLAPSCRACNGNKGMLTTQEFINEKRP